MGRTDLNGDGEYAFLYRELLFNIEHVEKVNEGELGHSRILIGTRGPKYGQHPTAAPATAHAFRTRDACLGMAHTLRGLLPWSLRPAPAGAIRRSASRLPHHFSGSGRS